MGRLEACLESREACEIKCDCSREGQHDSRRGSRANEPRRIGKNRNRASRGKAKGSALGSDAFFPMPDTVEEAAKAGVTAIIQPGGSVRDEDSIKKADEYGIAMVFTGIRHFKH